MLAARLVGIPEMQKSYIPKLQTRTVLMILLSKFHSLVPNTCTVCGLLVMIVILWCHNMRFYHKIEEKKDKKRKLFCF